MRGPCGLWDAVAVPAGGVCVCAGGGDALLAGRRRPLCALPARQHPPGRERWDPPGFLFISHRPVPAPHGNAERLGAGGRGRRGSDT